VQKWQNVKQSIDHALDSLKNLCLLQYAHLHATETDEGEAVDLISIRHHCLVIAIVPLRSTCSNIKYRTPPVPLLTFPLSPTQLSPTGTSTPTQGPSSPSTSPIYLAKARNCFHFDDIMHGMPISNLVPRGVISSHPSTKTEGAVCWCCCAG